MYAFGGKVKRKKKAMSEGVREQNRCRCYRGNREAGRAPMAPVAQPSRIRAWAGRVAVALLAMHFPRRRSRVARSFFLHLTLAFGCLLGFLSLLPYSSDSSSFSAISFFCSAVRFHGSHLSTSGGTWPPASAHASRYAFSHFLGFIRPFFNVASRLNIQAARFPDHSAPLPR